ncbi:patatin-like phospholipase family protein [Litorisediminicola beolgyonensis]|uniref:Patatin-like phospholipase family protein n=1 Tax=Litorisediminicola beolgyonensis TaxID=1173614 RepID=A0ABW3ZH68_9RHOB
MTSKRINIALQGGGAHGAFTWGVLDRLLDDERIEIAAISGTSAGAINGAAYKAGWMKNGREGAREELDWLWSEIGRLDALGFPEWMNAWLPDPGIVSLGLSYSPAFLFGDSLARATSPYAWGPLYDNPLRPIVERFEYEHVCSVDGPQLFVCATSVRDGKVRVFSRDKLTTGALMASACLPTLFQAVEEPCPNTGEIEAFWDGGYSANPALFPLYQQDLPDDIVVVNINPLHRDAVPITAQEIQNRINEISFNSALLRDLRAVNFVQRLIATGAVGEGQMKNVLVHMIADDELMNRLSVATKLTPIPSVILQLKKAGRAAAETFLDQHFDDLNVSQTVDLVRMFG